MCSPISVFQVSSSPSLVFCESNLVFGVAFWSFLYFVGFCYLTKQWGVSPDPPNGIGVNNVQAAIAFSFFSIFTWVSFQNCSFFILMKRKFFLIFAAIFRPAVRFLHTNVSGRGLTLRLRPATRWKEVCPAVLLTQATR